MADEEYINALTGALREPYANYWVALGEFIHHFSKTEMAMQSLLWHLAGTSDAVGRAAFSGVKVDAASSLISRILDAKGDEETKARLTPVFQQLGIINGVRNNIVHWGADHQPDTDTYRVSNKFFAVTPDRVTEYAVSLPEMHQMMGDLMKIGVHLGWEATRSSSRIPEAMERALRPTLEAAWLYKQPPRQTHPKASRKKAQGRQRQRASSQESH